MLSFCELSFPLLSYHSFSDSPYLISCVSVETISGINKLLPSKSTSFEISLSLLAYHHNYKVSIGLNALREILYLSSSFFFLKWEPRNPGLCIGWTQPLYYFKGIKYYNSWVMGHIKWLQKLTIEIINVRSLYVSCILLECSQPPWLNIAPTNAFRQLDPISIGHRCSTWRR
jgi:hypothetical protein